MTILETAMRKMRDESKPLARFDEEHNVLWLDDLPIPIRPGSQSNRDLLRALASTIRDLRGLPIEAPCELRQSELATFAALLDLAARSLRKDIRTELGLSKRESGRLLARLRRVSS